MKVTLFFEIVGQRDCLVMEIIVDTLRRQGLVPEALVWSMIEGTNEGRLWVKLEATAAQIDALTAFFLTQPTIKRVVRDKPPAPGRCELLRRE